MLFKPLYTENKNNSSKVDWDWLSGNPNAIHLLFKYNYQNMKKNNKQFL